jgi:hypothetical protein
MTRTIIDDKILTAATKALKRAIIGGYSGNEAEWLYRWLDRAGIEVPDLQAFVRRARRALGNEIICVYPSAPVRCDACGLTPCGCWDGTSRGARP